VAPAGGGRTGAAVVGLCPSSAPVAGAPRRRHRRAGRMAAADEVGRRRRSAPVVEVEEAPGGRGRPWYGGSGSGTGGRAAGDAAVKVEVQQGGCELSLLSLTELSRARRKWRGSERCARRFMEA
jgi:hypothetical protein